MLQLDPSRFNSFLNNIGQDFNWRKAYSCPCALAHSGASDPNCLRCMGRGRIWDCAIKGRSGVAGQKVQREWAQFGMWESGDMVLTLPSDSPIYAMGEFDRVDPLNSSEPFSLNLTKGVNDTLWFKVNRIDRVFWLDVNSAIVEGGIPDVDTYGTLFWTDGDAPPEGQMFSMTGRKHPEYFCFKEFPQDRAHHGGEPLPRRVVLRKFDLFDRASQGA